MLSPSVLTDARPDALCELVESLKDDWRQGASPDALGAYRDHPSLLARRTLFIDLAYEEYCLREEAGSKPDPEAFCRALPAFVSQVREVLRGHHVLADHPDLRAALQVSWPQPGDSFEGLKIVRELGRGAFAHVYLARDCETDRFVALKLSPTATEEARRLGPIRHEHIGSIHWAKHVGNLHAICMPYVGAATLGDAIEVAFASGRTVPRSAKTILHSLNTDTDAVNDPATATLSGRESFADAVARIAIKLTGALTYLHRLGVAHGDIKPSNIILSSGGHPYLIDFNLAIGPSDSLVRCGGTLPYMAPERIRQLLGNFGNDPAAAPSDIYSLGVVLFEALTGKLPYPAEHLLDPKRTANDLLRQQSERAPDITTLSPEIPRSLARLVAGCLAHNAADRPTAETLKQKLECYLRRHLRRTRTLLGAAGFVLAASLGIGAGLLTADQSKPAVTASTDTKAPFDRGVAYLRANDVASALKVFGDLHREQPDGRSTALFAYCQGRLGNHDTAAFLYEEAAKKFGYSPAWLHSNRSYELTRFSPAGQYKLAVEEATIAIRLEPKLRAAHLNRAYAKFLLDLDPKTQTLRDPATCLKDMGFVMATGPYNADLYYKAALILASSASEREELLTRAVNYLEEAVKQGKSFMPLTQSPVFRMHLVSRQDFTKLAELPTGLPGPALNLHIINPLD